MPKSKKTEDKYIHAVGRRRESIARVRLYKGKGEILVNNLPIGKYFSRKTSHLVYEKPFSLTENEGKYYATIKVEGGGKMGQLGAVVHGLSRALAKVEPETRLLLKKEKLLTRDSRTRERRKVGMGGKARRKRQSPKR